MDLQGLNIFVQVAELNSFTKAGELLGYSQPTVSFQIKQLEKELGVQLFDRIGHTINLTDAGREVLKYAQQMIHISQEMFAVEKEHNISGKVRIAMADSLCGPLVADRFSEFRTQYPGISLDIKTAGTGDLFNLLDHNEADIVCTLDTPIHNTVYKIVSEEKIGVHFVVSTDNPLSAEPTLTIDEMLTQPFILTEKGMSYRRLLDEFMAMHSAEISPVLEISNPEIICKLIENNLGISFLPDYVTENSVREGKIVRLDAEGYNAEVWKQVLYHRDKWVSAAMKVAMKYLSSIMLG